MRGWLAACSTKGPSSDESVPITSLQISSMAIDLRGFLGHVGGFRGFRRLRLFQEVGDEGLALVHQAAALAAIVLGADGVLAKQRERDGRVAVGDDGVGEDTGID